MNQGEYCVLGSDELWMPFSDTQVWIGKRIGYENSIDPVCIAAWMVLWYVIEVQYFLFDGCDATVELNECQ